MSGTPESTRKSAETVKKMRGSDWYARIGAIGGKAKGVAKGFAANKKKAKEAGRIGGNTTSGKNDDNTL